MPGKYSYSAVLADYSSRGVINLPNDQHLAYLRSSPYPTSPRSRQNSNPWSDRSTTPQPRSKSALAYTNRYTPESGRVSSASRHVIIDDGSDSDRKDSSASKNRPNYPRPATSHDSRSLPKRGRQLAAKHMKDSTHVRTIVTPTLDQQPTLPVPRPNETSYDHPGAPRNVSGKNEASKSLRNKNLPPLPPLPAQHSALVSRLAAPPQAPGARPPQNNPVAEVQWQNHHNPPVIKQNQAPPNSTRSPALVQTPQRQASYNTRAHTSTSPEAEPDFAGFADTEERSGAFFDQIYDLDIPSPQKHVVTKTQPSKRLEPSSPRATSNRALEQQTRPQRPMSTEPLEFEGRADIEASPSPSQARLNSLTSLSSIDNKGTMSSGRTGRYAETKKSAVEPAAQDWRLPEIDENGAFGPDFFTQGPEDPIPRTNSDDSIDSFLNRPLGTVSAGRDIDLSNDYDDDSEVDAACPPDIGRFRNENEVKVPPLTPATKTSSSGSKGTILPTQTPKAKGGFFARFRPKRTKD